jgi:hypothetical protein
MAGGVLMARPTILFRRRKGFFPTRNAYPAISRDTAGAHSVEESPHFRKLVKRACLENTMRDIGAFEAKNTRGALLGLVERGRRS